MGMLTDLTETINALKEITDQIKTAYGMSYQTDFLETEIRKIEKVRDAL